MHKSKRFVGWSAFLAGLAGLAVWIGGCAHPAGNNTKGAVMSERKGPEVMRRVPDQEYWATIERDSKAAMGLLAESVTQEWKVPYGEVDGFKLVADVYYRDKRPAHRRPAIIYVHGGAWSNRSLYAADRQAQFFVLKENWLVVCMYYRLAQEAPFPAALYDVKACIRWVRSIADRYAVDPDQVVIIGSSAGAQLAVLAAATQGRPDYEGHGGYAPFSSRVNVCISESGAMDMTALKSSVMYLGGTPAEIPERYREASPRYQVGPGMPPTLMIHGDKDMSCPLEGARDTYERLRKAGVPAELVVMPGRGHSMFPEDFLPLEEKERTFIKSALKI